MKVLTNAILYDFETYIDSGFIAFDERIKGIGEMKDLDLFLKNYRASFNESEAIIELESVERRVILPGMLLGHGHVYSTFARGWQTPLDIKTFQDILDQQWWKLDRELDENDIKYSALMAGQAFLKQGITTIIDHHASGKMIKGSLDILKEVFIDRYHMKGLFCFETSDRFDIDACIDENVTFYEKHRLNPKVGGMLGMHASSSLSDVSLEKLKNTPKELPIHVHVAESIEDVEITKSRHGLKIINRFDAFGLLRENSLYAHGLYLTAEEMIKIKHSGGYMVYNPTSNMNNKVGIPPVDLAIANEMPWFIGNDGLGFGMSREIQNLFYTSGLRRNHDINLETIRNSIKTGYDYISNMLNNPIGKLATDYSADFVILPYKAITPIDDQNIFAHYFFGMLDHWHPKDVYSEGALVVRNYEISKEMMRDDSIYEKSEVTAQRLWDRLK